MFLGNQSNCGLLKMSNLAKHDEEFNNFMHKVTEIEKIVKQLASNDPVQQQIGDVEAKKYLENDNENSRNIDFENLQLKVVSNRSVINKNALKDEVQDQATMSQEAFKREVEKDANKRFEERKIRTEKMQTFKLQAIKAFNRNEFEKALSCYNKALDLIKDNHNLFLSRGLTLIKLKLYEKALTDIDRALYLNPNSLKGHLLRAKIMFFTQKFDEGVVDELKLKFPAKSDLINEYIEDMKLQDNTQ